MLNAALLAITTFFSTIQNVTKKEHERRGGKGALTFSAGSAVFAALFFLFPVIANPSFDFGILPYSIAFATAYSCAVAFSFLAIAQGSLSLSSLVLSYSLILPSLYGIFFLNNKVTPLLIIGIVLLVISVFLINFEKKSTDKKITLKWLIYIMIAFFGNGGCSIIQNMQLRKFEGAYKNEFMLLALLICFAVLSILAIIRERDEISPCVKKGSVWFGICGLANGACNLLVMVLTGRNVPPSVMFPIISGGGIVLTFAFSLFLYKEKFSKIQYVGVVLGICSIVLLNI